MHDEFREGRRGGHGDWRRQEVIKARSREGRQADCSSDQGVGVGRPWHDVVDKARRLARIAPKAMIARGQMHNDGNTTMSSTR